MLRWCAVGLRKYLLHDLLARHSNIWRDAQGDKMTKATNTAQPLYEHLRFVDSKTACAVLGVSSQTLRKWARNGSIGAIRTPGNRYRYNLAGLIVAATPTVQPQPKPQKRARVNRQLMQHQNELGRLMDGDLAIQASAPAPEAKTAPAPLPEPVEAMPAPKPERVAPKPPLGADALRSQFSSLAGASRW
jgi:excisionase family DNA binding protein